MVAEVLWLVRSWFLANDMQFFIVGSLVVAVYTRHRLAGYGAASICFVSGIVTPMIVGTVDDVSMLQGDQQDLIYDKPYNRVAPYAIGLLTAFIMVDYKTQIKHMNQKLGTLLALISVAGLLVIIYVTDDFNYNKNDPSWSQSAQLSFLVFSRAAWGCCCAMLVVACTAGHAGISMHAGDPCNDCHNIPGVLFRDRELGVDC